MTHSPPAWVRAGLVPAVVAFALLVIGCSSDPKPDRRGGAGPGPRRVFTPMAGQESFFDNRILAEIHVGTEGMPEPQRAGGEREGGPGGARRGGGGRMRMSGGPGGFGGDVSGHVPFGEGGRPSREFGGGPRPGMMMGGGGRPVMIHLRFTNRSDAPVELIVTDFVSPLGNFVVRPDKLKLAPGESMETEPMTSQLAGAFTETTATVAVRLEGKAEKKAFPLKQVSPPPREKQPD